MQSMSDKREVIVELNAAEWQALEQLATSKGISNNSLMRQALRLYQQVSKKISEGGKLAFVNKEGKQELFIL